MKSIHFVVYILINLLFIFLISTLNLNSYLETSLILIINVFLIFFMQKQTISEVENMAKKIINIDDDKETHKFDTNYIAGLNELKNLFYKINSDIKDYSKETQKPLTTSIEAILNSTLDGIIIVNNSRDIIMANDSFFRLCGYRAYEISGKDSTTMVSPENILSKSLIRFIKYGFENIDKDSTNVSTGIIEITHVKPRKTLKARATTLKYNENSVDGLVINLKDITKELEANEEKNKFVTNITHEFRTPLFSIMGYASLINEEQDLDRETIKNFGEIIYNESIRLSDIIDNLLNILTLDKPEANMNIEDVNVNNILEIIIESFDQKLKGSHLAVENTTQDKNIVINNNKEALSNIFTNIFNNAVKFADKNTRISVGVNKKDNEVEIYFTNTGIQIPSEYTEKIFERFFRIEDDVHSIPGAGLGLFISKHIAELHGGNISFESKDRQTTFTVTMPIISKYDKESFNFENIYSQEPIKITK